VNQREVRGGGKFLAQIVDEETICLNGNHPVGSFEQVLRQSALAGPNFDDERFKGGTRSLGNALKKQPAGQEMLA